MTDATLTTPLAFNSDQANSLLVHSYGQGLLLPKFLLPGGVTGSFTFGGVTYTASEITINTGLNYDPAYAVRFCRVSDLSNGVATKVWTLIGLILNKQNVLKNKMMVHAKKKKL